VLPLYLFVSLKVASDIVQFTHISFILGTSLQFTLVPVWCIPENFWGQYNAKFDICHHVLGCEMAIAYSSNVSQKTAALCGILSQLYDCSNSNCCCIQYSVIQLLYFI
jgi:hypothetical protein